VQVIHDPRRRRSVRISDEPRSIEIRTDDISRKHVLALLQHHLEREAKRRFRSRTAELSALTGIQYSRLFVRNQRTRWGSSSSKGNISVNWRAVMLPTAVQDYLIIHELAHQVHLNHSAAFWTVVERHCPDYRTANNRLKDNSPLISLFR
jgi:predicted metal-dependent hydrolase